MFAESHNLLRAGALVASLCALASSAASAQRATRASEDDWQRALAVIRRIALDKNESEPDRANAISAYARLLVWRKRHDDALAFCRQVVKSATESAVAGAALRAGCLVERDRRGYLRAELDFLASCSRGAHGGAASAIHRELSRAVQTLAALAARPMVPAPVVPRLPHWAAGGPGSGPAALRVALPTIAPPTWYRFQPGRAHPALHVTHPKMEPPHWYGRVSFPLLKPPKTR